MTSCSLTIMPAHHARPGRCRRWASEQTQHDPNFFTKLKDQQMPEWLW